MSAKRQAREESERKDRERRAAEDARQLLEWDYEDYCQREADRFIAENPAAFEAVKDAERTENRARHPAFSSEMIESIAQHEAKREIRKHVTLLTFEEFVNTKHQGTDVFSKPVAVSAEAPMASVAPPPHEATTNDEPAKIPSEAATAEDRGQPINTTPETAAQPATPEPDIELASAIQPQPGTDNDQPQLV